MTIEDRTSPTHQAAPARAAGGLLSQGTRREWRPRIVHSSEFAIVPNPQTARRRQPRQRVGGRSEGDADYLAWAAINSTECQSYRSARADGRWKVSTRGTAPTA